MTDVWHLFVIIFGVFTLAGRRSDCYNYDKYDNWSNCAIYTTLQCADRMHFLPSLSFTIVHVHFHCERKWWMDVIDRMDGDSRASPALWEMLFCYVTCRMHFMFTTRVVVCPLEGWYLCACYFLEIKLEEEGLYIYTVSQKKTRHQTLAHNFPKC